ncbi:MAG: family 10 glycosylhydrolase [Myxococcota bacterium]
MSTHALPAARSLLTVRCRAARALALAAVAALAACGGDEPPATRAPAAPREEPPADARAARPAAPRRALWVLAEGSQRVLEHAPRIDALLDDAEALGARDLFVQVYRGGRAWYDATLADAAPFRAAVAANGVDPLARLLARAHERGVRVHAWVNVLSLSQNAEAPIVQALGRDAVLVDRRGRSLLDYPGYEVPEPDRSWYRMGTPGLYLDPAAPGVRERIVATFGELLARYPALDGLHLDYIRHPGVLPFVPGSRFGVGLDFGYGEGSRARFQRETGLTAPSAANMVNLERWDAWRREQVTALVAAIAADARARAPSIEVSAAVIPYADRAYLTLAQDWRRWLEDGLLDFAVPMIYTLDDRLFRYQAEHFAHVAGGDDGRDARSADGRDGRVWAGVGVWLFARAPERARAQLAIARDAGLVDAALFSYDAMKEPGGEALLAALAAPPAEASAAAASAPPAAAATDGADGADDGRR